MSSDRQRPLLADFMTLVFGQDADLIYGDVADEMRTRRWVRDGHAESAALVGDLLRELAASAETDAVLRETLLTDWGVAVCSDPLTSASVRPWLLWVASVIDDEAAKGEG